MVNFKNENFLIFFIKYSLPILVIILSISATTFLYFENSFTFEKIKKDTEKNLIDEKKQRIKEQVDSVYNYIIQEQKDVEENLKDSLIGRTHEAHTIIVNLYKKYKDTKSKEELTAMIRAAIKDIRFNNNRGYFFVYDKKAINIIHPLIPRLEGKNLINHKDTKGTFVLQESLALLKDNEESYQEWYWRKAKNDLKEYKKIGFVKNIYELDWFIGTGEYIEDFSKDIQEKILDQLAKFKFGNNGYIFVISPENIYLSSQRPGIKGKSVFKQNNLKDTKDTMNRMWQKAQDGGGFITYTQKINPVTNKPAIKIAYVKTDPKWGWLLGTGFYLNEAEELIKKQNEILTKKQNENIQNLLIIAFFVSLVLLFISIYISNMVRNRFIKQQIAQKALIESENRFKDIIEHAPNPIIVHNEDGKVLMINKVWEQLSGYKFEEVSTIDNWVDQAYKEKQSLVKKHIKSLYIIEKKVDEGEFTFLTKNQQFLTWQFSSAPLGLIDGKKVVITSAMDVTELKRKNALLNQQNKMAAMGEMLGNIAHQWRQPLSTISTAATGSKFQKEIGTLNDEDFIHAMDTINESAQFLSQTIEDFRGFFNPKNRAETNFEISEAIERSLNLVNADLVTNDIRVIKNIQDYSLFSFRNELVQVLVNVLNNSRDALTSNGIEEKLIFVNTYEKNKKAYIEIYDNANGIDEKIIDRVFEPYFTTKHKSQGTGIGLYMSQDIIKNILSSQISVSNKKFNFENKDYVGACFTIELPKEV